MEGKILYELVSDSASRSFQFERRLESNAKAFSLSVLESSCVKVVRFERIGCLCRDSYAESGHQCSNLGRKL